jgi:hypothetical protein
LAPLTFPAFFFCGFFNRHLLEVDSRTRAS